jgi:hypothetical protein
MLGKSGHVHGKTKLSNIKLDFFFFARKRIGYGYNSILWLAILPVSHMLFKNTTTLHEWFVIVPSSTVKI